MDTLDQSLLSRMGSLMDRPNLLRALSPNFADLRLYAVYLVETYHYTRHNAKNQAAVAARSENIDINYLRYCLKHATEELGHENLALYDLQKISGQSITPDDLPVPLPETQALVDYLYQISREGNPLGRLGYSYWAERSYEYIQPILKMLTSSLGVQPEQMSFLVQHAEIDQTHAIEVAEVIKQFVNSDEDLRAVEAVMLRSLDLTADLMEAIFHEFVALKEGKNTRYSSLVRLFPERLGDAQASKDL